MNRTVTLLFLSASPLRNFALPVSLPSYDSVTSILLQTSEQTCLKQERRKDFQELIRQTIQTAGRSHTHTGTNILHNKGDKALPYHFPMTKLN